MGSLYRSEELCLSQMFLQSEAAYACVSELGELGLVQFRDLNPDVNAFQRKFVNEVRRCDEMERKLRFLEKEIQRAEIVIDDTCENPDAPQPREMIDLEANFEKLENDLKEVNTNQEALKRNFLELTELKHILRKTQIFFEQAELHHVQMSDDKDETQQSLLSEDLPRAGQPLKLGFVAGVISRERLASFERMLWRACRGNVFLKQTEIETPLEDPVTGDEVNKVVFIIFFQGDQLKSRVKKICEGFRASLYPCPETQAERREMAIGVMTRIEDLQTVLTQTQQHRHRVLSQAAHNLRVWFIKVKKIKAIYHSMNLFNLDVTQKCLIAECWCPVTDLDSIQLALRRGTERSGSSVPSILNRMDTKETPPTYHRTNKFTAGFQAIVDAYGMANYREVNPAPFTIITFPFLFAVMFGDLGHGFIMFLIAAYLVINEKSLIAKKIESEMFQMIFGGRYIVLLMGLFSMYTGLLYNDIYSKSINIFSTSWSIENANYSSSTYESNSELQLDPLTSYSGTPYPFGLDPIWALSENKITFLNSYKMKLSVIIGVSQMTFGVILSLANHTYFRRPLNIFCEFIPQMIFLMSVFGYLCFLIIYKWLAYDAASSANAPSLLIAFINMFMFTNSIVVYDGQSYVNAFLVVLAVLCVPWMLFVKPIYTYVQFHYGPRMRHLTHVRMSVNSGDETAEVIHNDELSLNHHDESPNGCPTTSTHSPSDGGGGGHDDHEGMGLGEMLIIQAIHTIEFCLGCISHTASYLRLWALSLAHAELSEVLWSMGLNTGLSQSSYIGVPMLYVIFSAWAILTIGILIIMEGLSAFLHTLRLHWVEFQTKFYVGEGYAFSSFSFGYIIDKPLE